MLLPCLVALSAMLLGPEDFAEAAGCRYGRIIIVGNDSTPDWVILSHLKMRPGQRVIASELKSARRQLQACNLFEEPKPTVELIPNELGNLYMDLRVVIADRPANWYIFTLPDVTLFVLTHLPEGLGELAGIGGAEMFELCLDFLESLADAMRRKLPQR